jgi:hypothetical protein
MSKEQLRLINEWIEDSKNQLILTPSWAEMNLMEIFNASINIRLKRTEDNFEGIPVEFLIDTTAKDIIYQQSGKKFGIHYRKNTGSGLITVVTLPLLDYKLIQLEDTLKKIWNSLLVKNLNQEMLVKEKVLILDDIHIYLIILAGANIDLKQELSKTILKCFGVLINEEALKRKCQELAINHYIDSSGLLSKGINLAKKRKLKSFIYTVRQRGEKEDGWI